MNNNSGIESIIQLNYFIDKKGMKNYFFEEDSREGEVWKVYRKLDN